MHTIVVTGSSGKAGRSAVTDLLAHGFDVRAVDLTVPSEPLPVPTLRADLRDYGQAFEALLGADSVVHLANIPAPGLITEAATFSDNAVMNYNVFRAAETLGMERVVWASSETTLGLPFDTPPRYAPIDEDHYPYPESSYALSKVVTETMAQQFSRRTGASFVALRFSNILFPDDYRAFPESCWNDPQARRWNLWGYIDARDAAQACRRALGAELVGAHSVIIAAADTVMPVPSAELMARVYPDTPLTREVGTYETLLAIDGARHLIGFEPEHSWRDTIDAP